MAFDILRVLQWFGTVVGSVACRLTVVACLLLCS